MSKVQQQELKTELWWLKLTNWLFEYPSFKNDAIFKVMVKVYIEFHKDEISEITKKINLLYKQLDEKNEQLNENQQEFKNTLGEIIEEINLFFKKIDEDVEGENQKKLKNNIILLMKLTQAVSQNFYEMWKEQK